MIIKSLFLHYVQISVSRPCHVSVLQWNTEYFFCRHIELNSRFIMMAINEVTFNRPKISSGFSVIFWLCRLGLFQFALKSSTEIFTPYNLFPPLSGFPEFVVSSLQFCCTICCWEYEFFSLLWDQYFRIGFFEDKFLMCPYFPILQNPQSECPLSRFLTTVNAYPRKIPGKTFLPNRWSTLIGLAKKWCNTPPVLQKEFLALWMVLRIFFHVEFCRLPGGLGHFADSNSIPQNQPTIFHRILIVQYCWGSFLILRTALSAVPFVSDRWVWEFDDSMIDIHKICQTPMIASVNNCWLLWRFEKHSSTLFRVLKSCCFARIRWDPLSGKILHHDSEPATVSRFTSFAKNFVIRSLLNHQILPLSTAAPVRFLQGALVILVLTQISQFRSFGKWVHPWFWCHLRRRFRIWVVNSSNREDLANGHPNPDCHSSCYFCFGFFGLSRTSPPMQLRHFAPVLDLEMYLKMCLTSPAVAMLKTNWHQNWMPALEQREVRNCPFCKKIFTCSVNRGFFDRSPSHRNIRVLRTVFQAIELQAYLREICTVTKRSRSWTKTCASSFVCTSPLAVTTTVGFLDLQRVSSSSEPSSLLLSMFIEAPESTTNSRSSGDFWNMRRCSKFSRRVKRSFVRKLELVIFSPNATLTPQAHLSWCKVSSFVLFSNQSAQGLHSWGSHIWIIPRDGPLSFPKFYLVPRALGEFDDVIWSQFSLFA